MKTQSTVAQCAAAVRRDLKEKYPSIKFGVRSESFSMGDAVNVKWIDGPLQEEVASLLAKYQSGQFNSMEDYYEFTNSRDDIPQTKYLQCTREASKERIQRAIDWVNKHIDVITPLSVGDRGEILGQLDASWSRWPAQLIHQMTSGYYSKNNNPAMDFSH
jgi:hypothetical protein